MVGVGGHGLKLLSVHPVPHRDGHQVDGRLLCLEGLRQCLALVVTGAIRQDHSDVTWQREDGDNFYHDFRQLTAFRGGALGAPAPPPKLFQIRFFCYNIGYFKHTHTTPFPTPTWSILLCESENNCVKLKTFISMYVVFFITSNVRLMLKYIYA